MNNETIDRIRRFTEDRDWDQFHTPANLAKSLVIEAAELLECFQWSDDQYDLQHVKEELADVIVYSQNLLDKLGLDADTIVNMKMDQNEAKYPVEKAKGRSDKYDRLTDDWTKNCTPKTVNVQKFVSMMDAVRAGKEVDWECPFCGGEVKRLEQEGGHTVIGCTSCDMRINLDTE